MTTTYRTITRVLLFSVITCSLLTASMYREFDLEIEGNSLSLSAENVPLRNILHDLQKQTNIRIRFLFPISESVSTRLEKIPVDHAVHELLRNFNHEIYYSDKENDRKTKVSEIVVISDKFALPTEKLFALRPQYTEMAVATLDRL